jgi:TPR repeat protein
MKLAQDFFTIAVEKLPDGEAENMLAEIYEAGLLGKDNQQKALHWYRKGYAKGSTAPSYIEYLKTQTLEHNNRSAAKRLLALADQNNAVAQLYLGAQAALKKENRNPLLAIGEAKQIEHLKRAAEAGLPRAQYLLSIMSRHGIGVKKDNKRALNLLKMAARNWHPDAQLEYGRHLHRNVMSLLTKLENANFTGFNAAFAVVKELERRAYRFIHSAAIQGNLGALMSAGVMIREGIGVEADPELAVKYFKVAAESGHAGGAYFYALSFFRGQGVEKDYQQALHWFTKSADAGDEDSAYYLGLMYRDGIGLASDVAKAVEWFTKSADKGSEEAAIALGDYYSDGKFSKPNLEEAQKWYQKAAAKGNKEAAQKLQRLKQEI